MKLYRCIFIALSILAFISCSEDPVTETKRYDLDGHIQKGPFINGSDITLYELRENYIQTGKSFLSSTGTQGEFEFNDIELVSPYVEIKADGYYHNEISGNLSGGRIILKAISDISELDQVNINILTHLEYERVKYLVSNADLTIQEAKLQAQHEILAIFSLDEYTLENSENLDISLSEQGDAILLAISAILQGNHTTSELSMMLADMISDMKEDGILNDTVIQSELLGQALALNCDQVGQNLMGIYSEIGLEVTDLNNFAEYVDQFITHSGYSISSPFVYPVSTAFGPNVLYPELTEIQLLTQYAFAVEMPGAGKIEVKMHKTGGEGGWGYQPFHAYGWNVSMYDAIQNEQVFTSTLNDELIDLPIEFYLSGTAVLDYYYNGAAQPAFSKTIAWGEEFTDDYIFPDDSPAGPNLLNLSDGSTLISDSSYTVGLRRPGEWDVDFVLSYPEGMTVEIPGGWGNFEYNDTGSQIDFRLSGKNEGDYISEIILKFLGSGEVNLRSNQLTIEGGTLFYRNYFVD